MTTVKRLEVVIDAGHLSAVIALLEEAGAQGYTVFSDVAGAGDRGRRSNDELSGALSNRYVLCACTEETLAALRPRLRQLLDSAGGLCLVSDAEMV